MKIRFNRILSFICAVMMICAVCAWAYAEEASATPTDLSPAEETVPDTQEPEQEPAEEPEAEPAEEPKEEPAEEPITSVELVITKALAVGGSWEGKVSKTKPAILKLDVKQRCTVHMLIEGKDIWATVEKSDRLTENPPRIQTDPDTDRTIISLEAEEGSYLITLGPVEPNLLGMVAVTFMDNKAYTAWEAVQEANEQTEDEPEEEHEEIPEETPEEAPVPDDENTIPKDEDVIPDEEENTPNDENAIPDNEDAIPDETEEAPRPLRHIDVEVTWDVPEPMIGDTAHFSAKLEGYDGLTYTMQWQYGPDNETWYDLPGETDTTMDVVVNEENNLYYWRIIVYIEDDQET